MNAYVERFNPCNVPARKCAARPVEQQSKSVIDEQREFVLRHSDDVESGDDVAFENRTIQ
jgi:hypothetical protein